MATTTTTAGTATALSDSPGIVGIGVSAGTAAGPVVRLGDPVPEPAGDVPLPAQARAAEAARIREAAGRVNADLLSRAAAVQGPGAEVLSATAAMALDPGLLGAAARHVEQEGLGAARAVWMAADRFATLLAGAGELMAARVADVLDVRDRLVCALLGRPAPGVPQRDEPFVLVARDLAPVETAGLDARLVRALVTQEGGPTSHTAIIARSLGIPAVVRADGSERLSDGTVVLVDGTAGTVQEVPEGTDPALVGGAAETPAFDGTGRTADGHPVALLANVGDLDGARAAAAVGAEGVGLFRTELCFLDRVTAPTVAEQVDIYNEVLAHFPGRKVVARTLDAGSDKPLPFLTAADEPNPALGVRGYRTSSRSPDVLDDQLSALAAAARCTGADLWVMAPMVSTAAEAADFAARAGRHGLRTTGVMVEVPALALRAHHALAVCDFASIGTNDLTQYLMAADRQLGGVAELNDPWQPALLDLVAATTAAGKATGKPVSVCGEAAADPLLACVLVGLGVTTLSMTPRAIPAVAHRLARVTRHECERAAGRARPAAPPAPPPGPAHGRARDTRQACAGPPARARPPPPPPAARAAVLALLG